MSEEAATPPSLDALYREHAPAVARWVAHLGGGAVDVEDTVHEIFLIARRRLPEFRGDAKVTTWLYRITERVVSDGRRKGRFRRWIERARRDELEEALAARPSTPVEQVERQQTRAAVYAVLDRLPEKYREALVLFELEGLSGDEIATLTGLALATVWVRLHRARERFLVEMKRSQKEST